MLSLYSIDQVDPRAVDNLAWYNLVGVAGCVLWVLAYLFAIKKGFEDRAPGLPLVAICLNFSWELLASFVLPNPSPLWHTFDRIWFFVDIVIVWQLLKYGPVHQTIPEVKRHFRAIVGLTFALGLVGQWAFVATYRDRLGLVAAFMINLIMSVLFVFMALSRRPHGRGISVGAAWFKMLGTLGTSIQCHHVVRYLDPELPNLHFLTFLSASIFAVDLLYAAMVTRDARSLAREGLPEPARAPAAA